MMVQQPKKIFPFIVAGEGNFPIDRCFVLTDKVVYIRNITNSTFVCDNCYGIR